MTGVDCDAGGVNLTCYAVASEQNGLSVTIINKDEVHDADVTINGPGVSREAKALRLTAPSLESRDGVTFSSSRESGGVVHMPAGSAAIVNLPRH